MWGGYDGAHESGLALKPGRWNTDDFVPAQPHEVCVHVKDHEAFDAVERLRWHETFLRTGSTGTVKVLKRCAEITNRHNTVFSAVHHRYNVVISVAFASLVTIDSSTGQCLYDRACLSIVRLIKSLVGDLEVGGQTLVPKIYLTLMVHQSHHSAVDTLCQDVLLDTDAEGIAQLLAELMVRLKAAEDCAFQALQQFKSDVGNPDTTQNPFAQGSLSDVLHSAMQRVPRQHNEGASVFVMVADFRRSFLNGAVAMSVRERIAACDAQLVLIDVGNDQSRQRNLHALAASTQGVLIDWAYFENMGATLGTIGQPELARCGYFGNYVGPHCMGDIFASLPVVTLLQVYPVALAAAIVAARIARPFLDVPAPSELSDRVRRAVLTRTFNSLGKDDTGMPWAIDGNSSDRVPPEAMKQESSGRTLVAKWTVALQDPAMLLETRVKEGWAVVYPSTPNSTAIQVAVPWMTGRNSRWLSATLVYEVVAMSAHTALEPSECDVYVRAHGPRGLMYEYDPQGGTKRREESSACDVQRLHEFVDELRRRDELKAVMLRERLSGSKDVRSWTECVVMHSTEEGCSQAWQMAAHVYSYSMLLSDGSTGNPSGLQDGLADIYDRVDNRLFDLQLYVQGIMQKWPSGAHSGDSNRAVLGTTPRPYVRRLISGGLVTAQFFSSKSAEGSRLPLCLEIRVSFFNVPYQKRKAVLNELKGATSMRSQGKVPYNQRQYQRHLVNVTQMRDELSAVLRDVLHRRTEQVTLEARHADTSDTDASLGDQQQAHGAQRASHRCVLHNMSVTPLSYQFTHRRWRWCPGEAGQCAIMPHIFNTLFQSRIKDKFVLLQSQDTHTDFVMYKGVSEAMVLYAVQMQGSAVEVNVWVEQSDRGRAKVPGAIAFSAAERFSMFERMYMEHSVVMHAYATFSQLSAAIEAPVTTAVIPHAKTHILTIADHDHALFDTPVASSWGCSRCGKRQAQMTTRWRCSECQPLEYVLCSLCVQECDGQGVSLPMDTNRFRPLPRAPSTVPLWKRQVAPEADGQETLRLPQADLLLRGSTKHLVTFPCISDCADAGDDQSTSSTDEKSLLAGLSEPLLRLLDALQDGMGQAEVVTRAKCVLGAPDTPTMKKAKAVLSCEPWWLKQKGDCGMDLTLKTNSRQLRSQLISAVEAVHRKESGGKTSSLGGEASEDRWTSSNAAGQLYSRLLNYVNLLCPVRVDVALADFPGCQYPPDLVPPFAPSLATAPVLHCFIRPADVRPTRPSDPVTSVVITVLPSLESARLVPVTLDTDAKPTPCFCGVVNEVSLDHLSWEVLSQMGHQSGNVNESWDQVHMEAGAKSPQSSIAFKKFLEAAHTMIFSFGVYRMLQCGEPVSRADMKYAQSACVDYVSCVDVTDLVQVHATPTNAIPHEQVNNALKSILDKNFGRMKGTECHYFFRGHTDTEALLAGSHRQSVVHTRVSAASSRALTTTRPRIAGSIASSAAAPASVNNNRPANEGLTAATVALIPSATGLAMRPQVLNGDVDDGKTSFPSAPSIHTSTDEGDEPECDSPRLADGQSRLCDTSACYDSDSEESAADPPGSATTAPAEHPTVDEGDNLPLFLMMTLTYEFTDRPGLRRAKQSTYSLPIHHTVLNAADLQPKLPVVSGVIQSARLSLVASSIPRQYFELSSHGFRPTRREAVRKCVHEVPVLESFRRFSTVRGAYYVSEEGAALEQNADPYQFFPNRPKKLMERTMRRVQAEVHHAQLAHQLTHPTASEPPPLLAARIEALRPRHWTKLTLRLVVLGDPLKKPHLALFFRDWLTESPSLTVLNQQDKLTDDDETMVLSLATPAAAERAVVAALALMAAMTGVLCSAVPQDVAEKGNHTPLTYWLLLKIMGVKAAYRGPGGVHGLGMDRSVIKLRLWFFGPEYLQALEQQALVGRALRCVRNVQMNLNRALLLEDCHALSPHCISDLLVPPETQLAVKYTSVKAAVTILVYTYCSVCQSSESSSRRRAQQTTTHQAVTPQSTIATNKPRGKSASVVRPASAAGESVQSFSLLNSSMQNRERTEQAPQTGLLIARDSLPTEHWERWGGLACNMHIVAELNLGVYTEPADVDSCLFQVWNNWQVDNRLRTYLWRGKDEVYYFQFKLTAYVDYLPYKSVALAGCVAAMLASTRTQARANTAGHIVCLAAAIASLYTPNPGAMMTHVVSQEILSVHDFNPSVDSLVSLPREPSATFSNTLSQTVSGESPFIEPEPHTPSVDTSMSQSASQSASQSQSHPVTAHEVDRGRLRATMMLYSVRPPPEEIVAPLAMEFKGCMRSATVLALGGHLQKTDGKLSYENLMELQQRAEKTLFYGSVLPAGLAPRKERILEYVHSHMKKWATKVRLTSEPLPDVPPPHFIYPRISAGRGDSRHSDARNTQWLACIHASLGDVATPPNAETGASDLGALLELEDMPENAASLGLRFQMWINGDSKDLEPAITLVREALQSCIVQVFCEASIETRLPPLDKVTVSDLTSMQPLFEKSQGQQAKWGRRRQYDRQWESCVVREYKGTIQPSSALSLVHDIVLMMRDLHGRMVNEDVRTRQSSLQPVAFYTEAALAEDDWAKDVPVDGKLLPVPEFSTATLKQHHDRIQNPNYDYYVVCGRDEHGALSDSWTAMHYAQSVDEAQMPQQSCPTPSKSDLLRFYDSEESSARPCFLCVKVSACGIDIVSYNLKGEFVKGVQVGISSIVVEVQKRYVLQASILHQKMGLSLASQALAYPADALLIRDAGVPEVSINTADDIFMSLPYTKEILESTLAEATGVKLPGGRGGPVSSGRVSAPRRPSASQWAATKGTTLSGMLFASGGISSRAAAAAAAVQYPHVQSGKVSSDLARHFSTFKSIVATEQQTAQQLRARDAVCREMADFREAIKAHGPKERPSCVLYCSPQATLHPSTLLCAGLCAVAVASVLDVTPRQSTRQQTITSAAIAAALLIVVSLDLPAARKVDSKHLRVVTGRCPPDSGAKFGVWPAYFASRTKLKGFVANCIRMRQSSRLYHCQRVPFLLNKSRRQLLLGAGDEANTPYSEDTVQMHPTALAGWRRLLTRLMKGYLANLTSETEKKVGVEGWLTVALHPDDLTAVDKRGPSQDDEVVRNHLAACASLWMGGGCASSTTNSFITVAEASGGVILIDLSVRESCFALEFSLFDAAAANNARTQDNVLRGSPTGENNPAKFHRMLAQIRSQLHMNSMFYDLQLAYAHEALRAETPRSQDPVIEWLSFFTDAVLLYERAPLYSVNFVGCKRVTVTVPQEILSEIHTADEGSAELTSEAQKKALGRFFGYVCKQSRQTLRSGDTVALLMHDDTLNRNADVPYECDGVAICRLDTLDTGCLALPIDLHLLCVVDMNLGKERKLSPPPEDFIHACYAAFRDDVKRRCDDAVRNYRIHRLWKRMQQQKITTAEVNGLLGRDEAHCSVAKREVVPMMDPSCLTCFQDLDVDAWADLCAACARRHRNDRFAIFAPSHRDSLSDGDKTTPHWLFVPRRPSEQSFNAPTNAAGGPTPGAGASLAPEPHAVIVEFTAQRGVSIWWCSSRAASEHPVSTQHTPAPNLSGDDARFFADWVNAITETLWAISC